MLHPAREETRRGREKLLARRNDFFTSLLRAATVVVVARRAPDARRGVRLGFGFGFGARRALAFQSFTLGFAHVPLLGRERVGRVRSSARRAFDRFLRDERGATARGRVGVRRRARRRLGRARERARVGPLRRPEQGFRGHRRAEMFEEFFLSRVDRSGRAQALGLGFLTLERGAVGGRDGDSGILGRAHGARATTRALGGRAWWTGRARGGVARGGVECASRARREGESSSSPLGDGFTKARDARDGAL